jgi:hypothetical protein
MHLSAVRPTNVATPTAFGRGRAVFRRKVALEHLASHVLEEPPGARVAGLGKGDALVHTTRVWSRIALQALIAISLGSAAFAQELGAETPGSRPAAGWSAPALHASLAVTFIGLQAVDVATTLDAVRSGKGIEANPLVGGLANHPAAFVAVKSALATATVLSIKSFSKKHPKGAVFAMIGLNAASAFVVRSNLAVVAR